MLTNTKSPVSLVTTGLDRVPRASLTEDLEGARSVMANLEAAGISIDTVTGDLVIAGVKQFEDAFTKLLAVTQP